MENGKDLNNNQANESDLPNQVKIDAPSLEENPILPQTYAKDFQNDVNLDTAGAGTGKQSATPSAQTPPQPSPSKSTYRGRKRSPVTGNKQEEPKEEKNPLEPYLYPDGSDPHDEIPDSLEGKYSKEALKARRQEIISEQGMSQRGKQKESGEYTEENKMYDFLSLYGADAFDRHYKEKRERTYEMYEKEQSIKNESFADAVYRAFPRFAHTQDQKRRDFSKDPVKNDEEIEIDPFDNPGVFVKISELDPTLFEGEEDVLELIRQNTLREQKEFNKAVAKRSAGGLFSSDGGVLDARIPFNIVADVLTNAQRSAFGALHQGRHMITDGESGWAAVESIEMKDMLEDGYGPDQIHPDGTMATIQQSMKDLQQGFENDFFGTSYMLMEESAKDVWPMLSLLTGGLSNYIAPTKAAVSLAKIAKKIKSKAFRKMVKTKPTNKVLRANKIAKQKLKDISEHNIVNKRIMTLGATLGKVVLKEGAGGGFQGVTGNWQLGIDKDPVATFFTEGAEELVLGMTMGAPSIAKALSVQLETKGNPVMEKIEKQEGETTKEKMFNAYKKGEFKAEDLLPQGAYKPDSKDPNDKINAEFVAQVKNDLDLAVEFQNRMAEAKEGDVGSLKEFWEDVETASADVLEAQITSLYSMMASAKEEIDKPNSYFQESSIEPEGIYAPFEHELEGMETETKEGRGKGKPREKTPEEIEEIKEKQAEVIEEWEADPNSIENALGNKRPIPDFVVEHFEKNEKITEEQIEQNFKNKKNRLAKKIIRGEQLTKKQIEGLSEKELILYETNVSKRIAQGMSWETKSGQDQIVINYNEKKMKKEWETLGTTEDIFGGKAKVHPFIDKGENYRQKMLHAGFAELKADIKARSIVDKDGQNPMVDEAKAFDLYQDFRDTFEHALARYSVLLQDQSEATTNSHRILAESKAMAFARKAHGLDSTKAHFVSPHPEMFDADYKIRKLLATWDIKTARDPDKIKEMNPEVYQSYQRLEAILDQKYGLGEGNYNFEAFAEELEIFNQHFQLAFNLEQIHARNATKEFSEKSWEAMSSDQVVEATLRQQELLSEPEKAQMRAFHEVQSQTFLNSGPLEYQDGTGDFKIREEIDDNRLAIQITGPNGETIRFIDEHVELENISNPQYFGSFILEDPNGIEGVWFPNWNKLNDLRSRRALSDLEIKSRFGISQERLEEWNESFGFVEKVNELRKSFTPLDGAESLREYHALLADFNFELVKNATENSRTIVDVENEFMDLGQTIQRRLALIQSGDPNEIRKLEEEFGLPLENFQGFFIREDNKPDGEYSRDFKAFLNKKIADGNFDISQIPSFKTFLPGILGITGGLPFTHAVGALEALAKSSNPFMVFHPLKNSYGDPIIWLSGDTKDFHGNYAYRARTNVDADEFGGYAQFLVRKEDMAAYFNDPSIMTSQGVSMDPDFAGTSVSPTLREGDKNYKEKQAEGVPTARQYNKVKQTLLRGSNTYYDTKLIETAYLPVGEKIDVFGWNNNENNQDVIPMVLDWELSGGIETLVARNESGAKVVVPVGISGEIYVPATKKNAKLQDITTAIESKMEETLHQSPVTDAINEAIDAEIDAEVIELEKLIAETEAKKEGLEEGSSELAGLDSVLVYAKKQLEKLEADMAKNKIAIQIEKNKAIANEGEPYAPKKSEVYDENTVTDKEQEQKKTDSNAYHEKSRKPKIAKFMKFMAISEDTAFRIANDPNATQDDVNSLQGYKNEKSLSPEGASIMAKIITNYFTGAQRTLKIVDFNSLTGDVKAATGYEVDADWELNNDNNDVTQDILQALHGRDAEVQFGPLEAYNGKNKDVVILNTTSFMRDHKRRYESGSAHKELIAMNEYDVIRGLETLNQGGLMVASVDPDFIDSDVVKRISKQGMFIFAEHLHGSMASTEPRIIFGFVKGKASPEFNAKKIMNAKAPLRSAGSVLYELQNDLIGHATKKRSYDSEKMLEMDATIDELRWKGITKSSDVERRPQGVESVPMSPQLLAKYFLSQKNRVEGIDNHHYSDEMTKIQNDIMVAIADKVGALTDTALKLNSQPRFQIVWDEPFSGRIKRISDVNFPSYYAWDENGKIDPSLVFYDMKGNPLDPSMNEDLVNFVNSKKTYVFPDKNKVDLGSEYTSRFVPLVQFNEAGKPENVFMGERVTVSNGHERLKKIVAGQMFKKFGRPINVIVLNETKGSTNQTKNSIRAGMMNGHIDVFITNSENEVDIPNYDFGTKITFNSKGASKGQLDFRAQPTEFMDDYVLLRHGFTMDDLNQIMDSYKKIQDFKRFTNAQNAKLRTSGVKAERTRKALSTFHHKAEELLQKMNTPDEILNTPFAIANPQQYLLSKATDSEINTRIEELIEQSEFQKKFAEEQKDMDDRQLRRVNKYLEDNYNMLTVLLDAKNVRATVKDLANEQMSLIKETQLRLTDHFKNKAAEFMNDFASELFNFYAKKQPLKRTDDIDFFYETQGIEVEAPGPKAYPNFTSVRKHLEKEQPTLKRERKRKQAIWKVQNQIEYLSKNLGIPKPTAEIIFAFILDNELKNQNNKGAKSVIKASKDAFNTFFQFWTSTINSVKDIHSDATNYGDEVVDDPKKTKTAQNALWADDHDMMSTTTLSNEDELLGDYSIYEDVMSTLDGTDELDFRKHDFTTRTIEDTDEQGNEVLREETPEEKLERFSDENGNSLIELIENWETLHGESLAPEDKLEKAKKFYNAWATQKVSFDSKKKKDTGVDKDDRVHFLIKDAEKIQDVVKEQQKKLIKKQFGDQSGSLDPRFGMGLVNTFGFVGLVSGLSGAWVNFMQGDEEESFNRLLMGAGGLTLLLLGGKAFKMRDVNKPLGTNLAEVDLSGTIEVDPEKGDVKDQISEKIFSKYAGKAVREISSHLKNADNKLASVLGQDKYDIERKLSNAHLKKLLFNNKILQGIDGILRPDGRDGDVREDVLEAFSQYLKNPTKEIDTSIGAEKKKYLRSMILLNEFFEKAYEGAGVKDEFGNIKKPNINPMSIDAEQMVKDMKAQSGKYKDAISLIMEENKHLTTEEIIKRFSRIVYAGDPKFLKSDRKIFRRGSKTISSLDQLVNDFHEALGMEKGEIKDIILKQESDWLEKTALEKGMGLKRIGLQGLSDYEIINYDNLRNRIKTSVSDIVNAEVFGSNLTHLKTWIAKVEANLPGDDWVQSNIRSGGDKKGVRLGKGKVYEVLEKELSASLEADPSKDLRDTYSGFDHFADQLNLIQYTTKVAHNPLSAIKNAVLGNTSGMQMFGLRNWMKGMLQGLKNSTIEEVNAYQMLMDTFQHGMADDASGNSIKGPADAFVAFTEKPIFDQRLFFYGPKLKDIPALGSIADWGIKRSGTEGRGIPVPESVYNTLSGGLVGNADTQMLVLNDLQRLPTFQLYKTLNGITYQTIGKMAHFVGPQLIEKARKGDQLAINDLRAVFDDAELKRIDDSGMNQDDITKLGFYMADLSQGTSARATRQHSWGQGAFGRMLLLFRKTPLRLTKEFVDRAWKPFLEGDTKPMAKWLGYGAVATYGIGMLNRVLGLNDHTDDKLEDMGLLVRHIVQTLNNGLITPGNTWLSTALGDNGYSGVVESTIGLLGGANASSFLNLVYSSMSSTDPFSQDGIGKGLLREFPMPNQASRAIESRTRNYPINLFGAFEDLDHPSTFEEYPIGERLSDAGSAFMSELEKIDIDFGFENPLPAFMFRTAEQNYHLKNAIKQEIANAAKTDGMADLSLLKKILEGEAEKYMIGSYGWRKAVDEHKKSSKMLAKHKTFRDRLYRHIREQAKHDWTPEEYAQRLVEEGMKRLKDVKE